MTRDEILNIPAGREMDTLIAQQVMNWEYDASGDAWIRPGKSRIGCNEFRPSDDIAAAWEVVEKLCNETGCDIVKVCKRDPELFGEWSCNFGRGFEAFGDTASLAICRAALLVVLETT